MTSKTKWKLALCTFGGPFIVATISHFFCGTKFDQWASFVEFQTPWVLGLYAAADVTQKAILAKLAPKDGGK